MRSKKRDTFLIGHARRMRRWRGKQRRENFEAYRNRVNTQKRQYRIRIRSVCSTQHQTLQQLQSLIKTRRNNKKRQRRYRINQSEDIKKLYREKDRLRKRLKRQQQTLRSNNHYEQKL